MYYNQQFYKKGWFIDSGCTYHMTHDQKLFKEINKLDVSKVKIGSGE